MKNLIIIALLVCASLCTRAQNNKPASQPDSIIRIINDGRHQLYTIGGKLVTPDEVKIRLLAYSPSATEFKKVQNNLTWTYVGFGASFVCTTIAFADFKNNNKFAGETLNNDGTITYQQHSHTGAYIFTSLATGFLVSSVVTLINAAHHGQKALNVYNQRFE